MRTFRYKQNRLQQLRGFCAVVETRSVSKAANRLNLTQPTVSLQGQSLERDCEPQAVRKTRPRIELTHEGALLYELARPLVEGLLALDRDFEDRRNNVEQGRLWHRGRRIHHSLRAAADRSAIFFRTSGHCSRVEQRHGHQGLQQLRERDVDFCVGPILIRPRTLHRAVVAFDPVLITRRAIPSQNCESHAETSADIHSFFSAPPEHVAAGGDGFQQSLCRTKFGWKWAGGRSSSGMSNSVWESRS